MKAVAVKSRRIIGMLWWVLDFHEKVAYSENWRIAVAHLDELGWVGDLGATVT